MYDEILPKGTQLKLNCQLSKSRAKLNREKVKAPSFTSYPEEYPTFHFGDNSKFPLNMIECDLISPGAIPLLA